LLLRSLVITNPSTNERICLDVTFTDPGAQVNTLGRSVSTSEGLRQRYLEHVKTYGKICEHHKMLFAPLAYDTLGRAHKDSAAQIRRLFTIGDPTKDRKWSTAKVTRLLSDGLHCVSAAAVLRASGVPTHCSFRRTPGSRAAGA